MPTKLPPIEKIAEAWSAIADNRITMSGECACVRSSNGEKQYTVTWREDIYTSNDSATYWQGYAGYPIIAVLMLQGKLPYNRQMASVFGGVNWTALNGKYKRDYTKAVGAVLDSRSDTAFRPEQVLAEMEGVHRQLAGLSITVKRGSLRPPKVV